MIATNTNTVKIALVVDNSAKELYNTDNSKVTDENFRVNKRKCLNQEENSLSFVLDAKRKEGLIPDIKPDSFVFVKVIEIMYNKYKLAICKEKVVYIEEEDSDATQLDLEDEDISKDALNLINCVLRKICGEKNDMKFLDREFQSIKDALQSWVPDVSQQILLVSLIENIKQNERDLNSDELGVIIRLNKKVEDIHSLLNEKVTTLERDNFKTNNKTAEQVLSYIIAERARFKSLKAFNDDIINISSNIANKPHKDILQAIINLNCSFPFVKGNYIEKEKQLIPESRVGLDNERKLEVINKMGKNTIIFDREPVNCSEEGLDTERARVAGLGINTRISRNWDFDTALEQNRVGTRVNKELIDFKKLDTLWKSVDMFELPALYTDTYYGNIEEVRKLNIHCSRSGGTLACNLRILFDYNNLNVLFIGLFVGGVFFRVRECVEPFKITKIDFLVKPRVKESVKISFAFLYKNVLICSNPTKISVSRASKGSSRAVNDEMILGDNLVCIICDAKILSKINILDYIVKDCKVSHPGGIYFVQEKCNCFPPQMKLDPSLIAL